MADDIPKIAEFYTVAALRQINAHYDEDLLPKNVNRRLLKLTRQSGVSIDSWLTATKKYLHEIGNKSQDSLIKKALNLSIVTAGDIDKKWDRKVEAIEQLVGKIRPKMKTLVGNKLALILKDYKSNNLDSAFQLVSLVKKMGLDKEYHFVTKWVYKIMKGKHPKNLAELVKSGKLPKEGLEFIKEAVVTRKAEKGPITPETHPGYFTQGKEKLRLFEPIKAKLSSIKYNPKWKEKTDDVWYASSQDPDTGDTIYHHTLEFMKKGAGTKWNVLKELEESLPGIRKKVKKGLSDSDAKIRTIALVITLVDQGRFRIGNLKSEKDNVRGLSNLQVQHLSMLKGNKIKFKYVGKGQKVDAVTLKVSPSIYKALKESIKDKAKDDYIFAYKKGKKYVKVRPSSVNKFFKNFGSPTTIHRFRALHATNAARQLLLKDKLPFDAKTAEDKVKKSYLKDAIKKVQMDLRHESPATTKNSYIDPEILESYEKRVGLSKAKAMVEEKSMTQNIVLDQLVELGNIVLAAKTPPTYKKASVKSLRDACLTARTFLAPTKPELAKICRDLGSAVPKKATEATLEAKLKKIVTALERVELDTKQLNPKDPMLKEMRKVLKILIDKVKMKEFKKYLKGIGITRTTAKDEIKTFIKTVKPPKGFKKKVISFGDNFIISVQGPNNIVLDIKLTWDGSESSVSASVVNSKTGALLSPLKQGLLSSVDPVSLVDNLLRDIDVDEAESVTFTINKKTLVVPKPVFDNFVSTLKKTGKPTRLPYSSSGKNYKFSTKKMKGSTPASKKVSKLFDLGKDIFVTEVEV